MTRTPLYFKRGTKTGGPRPYRRLVRRIRSAWRVANTAEAAIQRVRDALDRYVVTPYSECSQTDALAAIRDALDGSMASAAGVTPRGPAPRFAPSTAMAMRDPYLDALEQLDQMRDRAFEAEATIQRVRELHAPIRVDLAGSERCGYCAILPWPCDTIRALDGDSDE